MSVDRTIAVRAAINRSWAGLLEPDALRIGMGFDVATTLKKKGKGGNKSNPSAICVLQQVGLMFWSRLFVRFRTNDPKVAKAIIEAILADIASARPLLRVRKLCVDATNERFFAANLKSEFAGRLIVDPVVGSEGMEYRGLKMTMKAYLGNQLVDHIEDGYFTMPELAWLQSDFRLVKRVAESFDAEIDEHGNHGDCFDAAKLALHALVHGGGPAEASAAAVGSYSKSPGIQPSRKLFNQFANRHAARPGQRRPI